MEAGVAADDGGGGAGNSGGRLGLFGLRYFPGLDAVAAGGGGTGFVWDLVEERGVAFALVISHVRRGVY